MIWSTEHRAELYRQALLRLVVGLYALVESVSDESASPRLPRRVRSAILLVLRPAESAARRLIFIEARKLDMPEYTAPPKREKSKTKASGQKRGKRKPRFRLIDPRKFLEELYPNRRKSKPKRKPATEPQILVRIAGFDGEPDFEMWSDPKPAPTPDDLINGTAILRRMEALKDALEDIPKQAKRMVREMAKRKKAPPGIKRVPPLRYGFPPGYRKKQIHEVDDILHECSYLARLNPAPDTS